MTRISPVFLFCLFAGAVYAAPPAAFDTAKIEELTGAKGALNEKEGVFKVSVPRSDLAVTGRWSEADPTDGPDFLGGIQEGR